MRRIGAEREREREERRSKKTSLPSLFRTMPTCQLKNATKRKPIPYRIQLAHDARDVHGRPGRDAGELVGIRNRTACRARREGMVVVIAVAVPGRCDASLRPQIEGRERRSG